NEGREPVVLVDRRVEDRGAQRPALREERHRSRFRHLGEERPVETGGRTDDPEAVRSDDPYVVLGRDFEDVVLEGLPRGTRLLEPGREDDHSLHAGLAALLDQPTDRRRRGGDDREVDRFRYRPYRGVRLDAQDLGLVVV